MTYWIIPACLFLYYAIVWLAVGRDPKAGPLVARYDAPEGLSPAALRYIVTSGSDRKTLVAALLSLAAKHCIELVPVGGGYRARRLLSTVPTNVPAEEKLVFDYLFDPVTRQKLKQLGLQTAESPAITKLDDEASIEPNDGKGNSALVSALQQTLSTQYRGKYFKSNLGFIAVGVLASAVLLAKVAAGIGGADLVWLSLEFLFAGTICSALIMVNLVPGMRDILAGRMNLANAACFLLGLMVISGIMAGFSYALMQHSNIGYVELAGSVLLTHALWAHLVKAPTLRGRRVMDDIAGFREFLLAVEQDRLDKLNHPNLTPQYLNQCLPYAVALDVKEAWGDAASDRLFQSVVPAR